MKKLFVFAVVSFAYLLVARSQVAEYSFKQEALTYTEITGGTVLWSGTFDNEVSGEITIPSFVFNATAYTSIFVSANGFITFGTVPTGTLYTPISSSVAYEGAISAFGRDLTNSEGGAPAVRYQQVGNEFVIQWKDVRRKSIAGEIISFQIRLNATNNFISIVYGGTISPGSNTTYPQVGLRGSSNSDFNNRTIAVAGGNWINSAKGTGNSNTMYFNSSTSGTVPSLGLTYTWKALYNPSDFAAAGINLSQIDLSWIKNTFNHNVMLAVNTTATFGVPVDGTTYSAGNSITGGGTVLYTGGNTGFSYMGLNHSTLYYYKLWSFDGVNDYSVGTTANCRTAYSLPYLQDFNATSFPAEWSGNMTVMASHGITGTRGLSRRMYSSSTSANSDSPLAGSISANTVLSFHYRIVDNAGYPLNANVLGAGDQIEIQLSSDDGATYSTFHVIDVNNHITTTDFANKVLSLSAYNGQFIRIRFLLTWATGDYFVDIDNVLIEEGTNMMYSGSTTEQPNTSHVAINSPDNEIIRLLVVTNKPDNPVAMTSITFNTTGSTIAANDIAAAKVFYTITPEFSATTQFGSTLNNPSGTFTITGSQPLAGGNNFFWLAYDIRSTATTGNVVDAQCTQFITSESGSNKTPQIANPAGNRKIGTIISGLKSIPGDYVTLAAAVTALNNAVIGEGGVTLNVAAGYSENITAPIVLTATGTSDKPLIFQKSGAGSNPVITRTDAGTINTTTMGYHGDGVIIVEGSDYVTFDGIDVAAQNQGIEYGYYLRKASVTDACKFVTIKNCNISMTRGTSRYVVGFCAANNGTATSNLTITTPGGAHEIIAFTSNTVQNVFTGIYQSGHSTFFDQDFTIGALDQGNIIQDFGGNVANESFGIYTSNLDNSVISYNNINNAAGGGVGFTGYGNGIFYATTANHSFTVKHNTINLSSQGTGNYMYGIRNTALGEVHIEHNTIALTNSVSSSGQYYFIYHNSSIASEAPITISSNTFAASEFTFTGMAVLISNTNNRVSPGIVNIQNNATTGTINKLGASGSFYCYYNTGSPTGIENISGNIFSNINTSGTSTFTGIYSDTHASHTQNVFNNTISNITSGTGAINCFDLSKANSRMVYGNQVHTINGGGVINVMNLRTGSQDGHIFRNSIYNIETTSTSTSAGLLNGILIASGSNVYVYNNFISDLRASVTNNADAIRGISITSTLANSNIGLYYNTIYLNATSTANPFGTSGIYHTAQSNATTALLDLRNNIVVNNSTAVGSGKTVAFRRSSSSLANFSETSDNNLLYAGVPGASNPIYANPTTYQTFETYQAHVAPRDASSHTELPPFVNVLSTPYDLHLQSTVPTLAEGTGQRINNPIAVDEDFDGDYRSMTTPDIGADEFGGISSFVMNPESFIALAISSQQISLGFEMNEDDDEVVIVFNTSGSFSLPSGEPVSGQPLANGTVLYIGMNSPFIHGTLTAGSSYYYKAFSYNGISYSSGLSTSAIPGVSPSANFSALPVNQTVINLSWNLNFAGHNVLITSGSGPMVGNPVNGNSYSVGETVPSAGLVIYKGLAEEFDHTGLNTWSQYYYKCWSFDAFDYYSTASTTNAITYANPVTNFPYLQNLDASWSHSPLAPPNWNIVDVGGSGTYTWLRSTSMSHSLPAGVRGLGIGNCNDYLISPPLVLPIDDLTLSWWEVVSNAANITSYKVLLSTTDKELESFTTELGDFTCTNINWEMRSIDLSLYQGQTVYLAFYLYYTTSSSYHFTIDDILIETFLPGPALLNWPENNITTFNNNNTLSWSPPVSSIPIDGYKLYFGTNPDPVNLVFDGLGLSYTSGPLQHNTTYYWKVVPYNINGDANAVPVWSFSTISAGQLAESFEDEWFPPTGWSNLGSWGRTGSGVLHGDYSANKFTSSSPARIVTPLLSIDPGSTLEFFAGTSSSTYQRMQVYYSTNKTTWNTIGNEISIIPGDWQYCSVDLNALEGNDYYLGIGSYFAEGGSGAWVYLDHVIGPHIVPILPAPAKFPEPMDESDWMPLQTSLKWYPELLGGIPSGYKVYFGTDGGGINTPTNMINGQLITQNTFTPPALSNNTVYYWKIIPTNSAGDAIDCPIWSFSTLPDGAVQIGYGYESWTGLPVDVEYSYTYSQSIYFQSEISIGGQWIEKIYYYWNSNDAAPNSKDWVIYLGHTEKTEFVNDFDWVPTSEMVKVFDGEVVLPDESGWIEITLDIPFQYNNDDNLVVAVDENTLNYDWGEFYATDTEGFRSLLYSSDSHNMNPDNPTEGGLIEATPNLRLIFESQDPPSQAFLTPEIIDFGQVLVQTISDPESMKVENIGGGILTISQVFIDGVDASHFSLANLPTLPVYLSTYNSFEFQVIFNPTTRNTKSAILKIQSNQEGGTLHEIALHGVGLPIATPQEFQATTTGLNSITLEWLQNPDNDDVMIAYNTIGVFGAPEDGSEYAVNQTLVGGGTIIYNGSLLNYIHTNLNASMGYYYKAWSVNATNNYSAGLDAYAQTLCNTVYNIPIFEDFESIPDYQLPVCWSRLIESSVKHNSHFIGVLYGPYSNNRVLTFYNYYEIDPTLIFISPELNASINTLAISFDFFLPGRKSTKALNGISVGVMSDPEDLNTFTLLGTFNTGDWVEEWTRLEYYFHQYNGTAKHIALKANYSYWSIHYMHVDNLLIDFLPSCIPPTGLQSSDISNVSAVINWQEGYQETEWQLKYGPLGFDPLIEGELVTDILVKPYLLENLQHSTIYDVYVRAACAQNDHSEWVGPHTFNTLCEAVACPVYENFDATPSGEIPICWSALSDENSFAQTIDNNPNSPPNCLMMTSYGLDDEAYLISPELTESISDLYISFFAKRSYTSGSLILGTMSDPTDNNTFQFLNSYTLTESWEQCSYNFENYSGNHQYIAFQINAYGTLFLDDIIIDIMTGCIRPSNLAVLGVTSGSALIYWNNGADESMWDLVFGQPGFDPETEGTMRWDITSKPYELTGLSASTSYHFYVRSSCEDELVSEWVGPLSITTLCEESERCNYTVLMTDSYGDGWDGTVLGIRQNGSIIETFGEDFENGYSYGPVNISLCPDLMTEIVVLDPGGYTDEKGFALYDPDGVLVFELLPGTTFDGTTVFHTFASACPSAVPVNRYIADELVQTGEDLCFDAEQTITTAGGGSYFIVEPGAAVLLIAGQNIVMLPGTHFQTDSYVHAIIDLNGIYCSNFTSVVSEPVISEKPIEDVKWNFSTDLFFKVYPNPNTGLFALELIESAELSTIKVEIFSLVGESIMNVNLPEMKQYQFDLSAVQPGIYLIRIIKGDEIGVEKVIKR
ncbi:MAG: choice-of-anchor J domain-containing protein [Bacteroidales bacterium]|nr:choice-of-anchor J domain-containing protein [Bacteroidales bacterium]